MTRMLRRTVAGIALVFSHTVSSAVVDCTESHDCEYFDYEHFFSPQGLYRTCFRVGDPPMSFITPPFELGPSFKVLSAQAAVRIAPQTVPGGYPWMFVYSDVSQPFLGGTNQYGDQSITFRCLERAIEPNNVPQPDIFVPVDNANLNGQADSPPGSYLSLASTAGVGHPVLALRKAFFWENSEDIECPHGPPGDIGIHIVEPSVVRAYLSDPNFWYQRLVSAPELWQTKRYVRNDGRTASRDLPGPIFWWINDCCCLGIPPDAHDEWTDGPWGAEYSNLGLFDWDGLDSAFAANHGGQIGLVVSESDATNPEDFLGAALVSRAGLIGLNGMPADEPIKLRMFGWLRVQNTSSGPEATVDFADAYVYPSWDGTYPVGLSALQVANLTCPVSCQNSSQCHLDSSYVDFSATDYPSCGSPAAVCQPTCTSIVDMPEGSSYRPFRALDTALANSVDGDVLGVFRGAGSQRGLSATRCTAGRVDIACPASVVAECEATSGTPVDFAVAGSDNCDFDVPTHCDHPAGSAFEIGQTTVSCVATTLDYRRAACTFGVDVTDTLPPEMQCPLTATLECSALGGVPSSDPLLLAIPTVKDECDSSPRIRTSLSLIPVGETTVTFAATDAFGNTSSCQTIVRVVDTVPPDISARLNPLVLWPPNHRMIPIEATVTATDVCSVPSLALSSITSNESDNGRGDGNSADDIQGASTGTPDFRFKLRAERSGSGNGRTYAVDYVAVDGSGNEKHVSTLVRVPHDRGRSQP